MEGETRRRRTGGPRCAGRGSKGGPARQVRLCGCAVPDGDGSEARTLLEERWEEALQEGNALKAAECSVRLARWWQADGDAGMGETWRRQGEAHRRMVH